MTRLGRAGVGVAHCPSSNLILASGIAPVVALRRAGVDVGLGVDGSSSADSASLWLEARQAMLLAKLRDGAAAGTARMALEMATLGGAACLGRRGELGVLAPGAVGDVAVWPLDRAGVRRRDRRSDRGVAAVRTGRRRDTPSCTAGSSCATACSPIRDTEDRLGRAPARGRAYPEWVLTALDRDVEKLSGNRSISNRPCVEYVEQVTERRAKSRRR